MAKIKKVPIRKCLATNEPFPKKEMFRIVRTPEGLVLVDDVGKINGRGAYISKTKRAVEIAKQKKVLDKQLEVTVPNEIYETLMQKLGDQ